MAKLSPPIDLAKLGDEKALAIAAYGESVASYRYIVMAEKSHDPQSRHGFEGMANEEREHRDRLQKILQRLSPMGGFYLTNDDKSAVCVGPRLVDARNDARFDEAMKLVIASEKRTSAFYDQYVPFAQHEDVRALFAELAAEGLEHVQRLREISQQAGKEISGPPAINL